MNSRVSPDQLRSVPSPASAADSSARTTVVPTATTRPPAARVCAIASQTAVRHRDALRVHGVCRELLGAHRLEGAGADVQRDERAVDAARGERGAAAAASKCRLAVGAATAPGIAREDALVALAIGSLGRRAGCRAAAARSPQRSKNSSAAPGTAMRHRSASRSSTRTAPPAVAISSPGRMGLLARSCTSASPPASARSSRISTRPPVGLCPSTRAGTTRVSLNTSRSSAAQQLRAGREPCGRAMAPDWPSSTSRRLAERSASGFWAISSGGSS